MSSFVEITWQTISLYPPNPKLKKGEGNLVFQLEEPDDSQRQLVKITDTFNFICSSPQICKTKPPHIRHKI